MIAITAIMVSGMMQVISNEEFNELVKYKGDQCISIFIPTHRSGVSVNEKQDAILLKNALQAITADLESGELPPETIESLLRPGFELYKDEDFWNNQLDGLAVFLADGLFKAIKLPFAVSEESYLNSSFFLSPLLPAINNAEEFYLLVISKHDAKFYQGNRFGLQKLEVEGLPNGMDDVVHFEEKEGEQLLRQGGKGGTGSANFHGHGSGQPDEKQNIGIYFKEVDRTLLTEVLHDKNSPLLLAGVEYLIPIYKDISKYKFVAEEAITGNQEHESPNQLFDKAIPLLAPFFEQRTKRALQNYYNQIATTLTSSMPEKVIPASYYAQISDLFICKDTHIWGRFNEEEGSVDIHTEKREGDICLINQAAINTIVNGGDVYMLEPDRMPKSAIVAAMLRF